MLFQGARLGLALVEHGDEGFGARSEEVEADEGSGRIGSVKVEHGGVGRLVEGVAGVEALLFAAFNLKNDGAFGDQSDYRTGMKVQAGLLMRPEIDSFDFHAMECLGVGKEDGEEGLANDFEGTAVSFRGFFAGVARG